MSPGVFRLRLFVVGATQNSMAARANLDALCRTHLQDRCEIEIVDVLLEPQRALSDGIFMTPSLLKLAPGPVCKIVGTLSNAQSVLQALGMQAATT
jgi:circadian clock protein KaiB